MAGVIFLKTNKLKELTDFYTDLGAKIWLEQPDIKFFKHENFIFAFQQVESEPDINGCITFFYQTKKEVETLYSKYSSITSTKLKENTKYRIYNFFAKDPEGRTIEFQKFLHDIDYSWN